MAVIAGVAVDIVANSKRPAASLCTVSGGMELCNVSAQGPISVSNRMAIAGDATWVVGAAAVAAGVVLVLVRRPPVKVEVTTGRRAPPPPPAAYLAPTLKGAVLAGSF